MAYATNKDAASRSDQAVQTFEFEGQSFDLCWKNENVLVYSLDDGELADRMAASLGTVAKHAANRHDPVHWKTFSLIPLTVR